MDRKVARKRIKMKAREERKEKRERRSGEKNEGKMIEMTGKAF